jgi:hypothetical protein
MGGDEDRVVLHYLDLRQRGCQSSLANMLPCFRSS